MNTDSPQVLVVDDEPSVLNMYATMLNLKGYTCICARNGEEALRIMQEARIDIIVTDEVMPGIRGQALLEYVVDNSPDTRRIMISGDAAVLKAAPDLLEQGLAHRILGKPCDMETFYSAFIEQVNRLPIR